MKKYFFQIITFIVLIASQGEKGGTAITVRKGT
jgi:hypothetical protein